MKARLNTKLAYKTLTRERKMTLYYDMVWPQNSLDSRENWPRQNFLKLGRKKTQTTKKNLSKQTHKQNKTKKQKTKNWFFHILFLIGKLTF